MRLKTLIARSVFVTTFALTPGVSPADDSLQKQVDDRYRAISSSVGEAGFTVIAEIDHARLAAKEEVPMPPSRVQVFSDAKVNTALLLQNIRAGLDLPFRILSYAEGANARAIYTSGAFLKSRHSLSDGEALESFDTALEQVITKSGVTVHPAATERLSSDYGIIELGSSLSVAETVQNLETIVKAQDDTVWFGQLNFTEEAENLGVELPEAVLLLFGGPAPGGVAMADYTAIGLDAFCQKLLVYASENGGSVILFNDIAAFAELYYGTSAKPHHLLNERLTATFSSAIK